MRPQRVAIIGAGTAGLSAATLLARQGHAITIVERARQLTTVGAGIMLQPSGIGVLRELGCLEHMQQYGHRIDALYGWIRSGRAIMQVKYAHLDPGEVLFGMGVHRASLSHVLDTALSSVPHQRWFGCEVNRIEDSGSEAIINFTRDGHAHREVFDAILVANGS